MKKEALKLIYDNKDGVCQIIHISEVYNWPWFYHMAQEQKNSMIYFELYVCSPLVCIVVSIVHYIWLLLL